MFTLYIKTKRHNYNINLNRLLYITFSFIVICSVSYIFLIDIPLNPGKYFTTWR